MDHQPDQRAGPDGDRWLDTEIALGNLFARARHIVLRRHTDRLHQIALAGKRQLGTHPEQGRQHDALEQLPCVEVDLVEMRLLDFRDQWDFEEVYGKLLDFARAEPLDPDAEDYLVHITTGTHVAQICLFLLTEARYLPGRLLQTQPERGTLNPVGVWNTIDLDLSRYDSIATRFAVASAESTSFLKSGIDTRNSAFNRVIDEIEQVALRSKAPILLMGPTGAGKSLLAAHLRTQKAQAPGCRTIRRGELCDAEGGQCDVGAIRASQRGLHRHGRRSTWFVARG